MENENQGNIEEQKIKKEKKIKKENSNILKSFIGGMLGALVVVVLFISVEAYVLQTQNVTSSDGETTTNTTSQEQLTGDVYANSVDSVITVVNQKVLTSDNALIQKYIDNVTNGEPIEQGVGSGFVYKKEDGYYYALTNNHVVDGSDEIAVITTESSEKDDSLIEAEILGTNELYDVAVVRFKTSQDIKPLEFANSDEVYPGEMAFAIGSPYGSEFQGSITSGIISAPIRTFTGDDGSDLQYIQTDAAINPGNSGGPLLNSDGKVIGMNTMKIAEVEADNMGFSIPTNVIIEIAADIEAVAQTDNTEINEDATFEENLNKLFS